MNKEGVLRTAGVALNGKTKQQSPLVHQVYAQRRNVLHTLVKIASDSFDEKNGVRQVLLLGAGYDQSYNEYGSNIFYVDYESIVSDASQQCMNDKCRFVAANLCDVEELHMKLHSAGYCFHLPTVVIIECVLCYLPTNAVDALLSFLSNYLTNSITIFYTPLAPVEESTTYCAAFLDGFARRGAPIRCEWSSIEICSTALRTAGFKHIWNYSMDQALTLLCPKGNTADPTMYDEFAASALLQRLYVVGLATPSVTLGKAVHQKLQKLMDFHSLNQLRVSLSLLSTRLFSLEQTRHMTVRLLTNQSRNTTRFPSVFVANHVQATPLSSQQWTELLTLYEQVRKKRFQ